MRRSKQATAESRRTITETASRLFRAQGFANVGVADVMQAAGMTHGGFYRHFASKEALMAEAMSHAFGEVSARLSLQAANDTASSPAARLTAYVEDYLSRGHVDHPELGCPIATMGTDAPHAGAEVGAAFATGAEQLVRRLTEALGNASPAPREDALRLLASLVGAIVIARAVSPSPLLDEVMAAVRTDLIVMRALGASSA
jgi:TetR/AcrR family transcriptional regulator, transcriptional repressor for nem operon